MLKYTEAMEVFSEIPDEVTLAINISNCPCACKGCHSPWLAKDIGDFLTCEELKKLLEKHYGISCVCFMGGDISPTDVDVLASYAKGYGLFRKRPIKVGWYSGREFIPEEIKLRNFDYIKLGPYKAEFGPLTSQTTNQRLYQNIDGRLVNITDKLWKSTLTI